MLRAIVLILLTAATCALAACNGIVRVRAQTPWGIIEGLIIDGHILHPCAVAEIDGQEFQIYCTENGTPWAAQGADGEVRRLPITPFNSAMPTPGNATTFELDGEPWMIMDMPDVPLDIDFQGTAEELLEQHGFSSTASGWQSDVEYHYDAASGLLDVRFAAGGFTSLPSPFEHDVQYENILVESAGGPSFVYHRVVGEPWRVQGYFRAAGVTDVLPGPQDLSDAPSLGTGLSTSGGS